MSSSASDIRPRSAGLRIPRPILLIGVAILTWFIVSEAATEAWYRWKESQLPTTQPWAIDWPTEKNALERGFLSFQPRSLSEREKEILRFKSGVSASWRDMDGNQWTGFYIEWDSDKILNQMDLAHNPTFCLPASGIKLNRELSDLEVSLDGVDMSMKCWEFEVNGSPAYVFLAIRRSHSFDKINYRSDYLKGKESQILKAFAGNRGNPLETVELICIGLRNEQAAKLAVKKQLGRLMALPINN